MYSDSLYAGYATTRILPGASGLPPVEIGSGAIHALREEDGAALCGATALWPPRHSRQLWEACVAPRCPDCDRLAGSAR